MIHLPLGLTLNLSSLASLASELPMDIILFFFLARILPMRHRPAFWAASLGLRAFLVLVAPQALLAIVGQTWCTILGVMLILFQMFVLPALFCPRGQRGKGLLLTALINIVSTGLGVLVGALFHAFESAVASPGAWSEAPASSIYLIIRYVLLAGGLCLLDVLVRRAIRRRVGRSSWPYLAALSLAFLSMIMVTLAQSVRFADGSVPAWTSLSFAILFAAFAGAALALAFSVEHFGRQQRAHQRAEVLNAQLDEVLNGYAGVNAEVERVARLRHDLKNQLLTAAELLRRGERDAAGTHLAHTVEELASVSVAGPEDGKGGDRR